jgi:hypothetical protein
MLEATDETLGFGRAEVVLGFGCADKQKELELPTLYDILKRVENTECVCGLTISLRETAFCGHSYSKCFGC